MLYQLTDAGRTFCAQAAIDPGPPPRSSLEHAYWIQKVADTYQDNGYEVTRECAVADGAVDLVAERPGTRIAIEVETGKSDIKANLRKLQGEAFDRVIVVATSPSATTACQRAIDAAGDDCRARPELLTWLDFS